MDVWSFGIHPAVCLSSGQESVAHFQPREKAGWGGERYEAEGQRGGCPGSV